MHTSAGIEKRTRYSLVQNEGRYATLTYFPCSLYSSVSWGQEFNPVVHQWISFHKSWLRGCPIIWLDWWWWWSKEWSVIWILILLSHESKDWTLRYTSKYDFTILNYRMLYHLAALVVEMVLSVTCHLVHTRVLHGAKNWTLRHTSKYHFTNLTLEDALSFGCIGGGDGLRSGLSTCPHSSIT